MIGARACDRIMTLRDHSVLMTNALRDTRDYE